MKYFVLIILTIFFLPIQAHALSCAPPSLVRDIQNAQAVFLGRITQVETVFGHEHYNKLHIIVETPYRGVKKGEELDVYQEHWEYTAPEWKESESNKREGIFALHLISRSDAGLGQWFGQYVYFIGQCSSPLYEKSEENIALLNDMLRELKQEGSDPAE